MVSNKAISLLVLAAIMMVATMPEPILGVRQNPLSDIIIKEVVADNNINNPLHECKKRGQLCGNQFGECCSDAGGCTPLLGPTIGVCGYVAPDNVNNPLHCYPSGDLCGSYFGGSCCSGYCIVEQGEIGTCV